MIIQSLWIGDKLSTLEQLSISSFIKNNHEYHLYCYNPIQNVPNGCILKDARIILPETEIFTYKNGSPAAFANYFRFHLLDKLGGIWVDTDVVCTKHFNFKEDFVFASEPFSDYSDKKRISTFFIKMPPNTPQGKFCIDMQKKHKQLILKGKMRWSSSMKTILAMMKQFNMEKYIKHWTIFCNCYYEDAICFIKRNHKPQLTRIRSDNVMIHLWNEMWRRYDIDKNKKYDDCLYNDLIIKYLH